MPEIPAVTSLVGRHVRLDPLTDDDVDALATALGGRDVFEFGWGGGLGAWSAEPSEIRPAFERLLANERPFVVRARTGPHVGEVIGTTSLSEFVPSHEKLHLGWTAYTAAARGTVVNPECKLLLLGHVFDHGWGRVRIQTDDLNARSKAAIAKLGATFEGVVRREQPRADGTWRNTAMFSVIIDDWPRVRAALEARVNADVGSLNTTRPADRAEPDR